MIMCKCTDMTPHSKKEADICPLLFSAPAKLMAVCYGADLTGRGRGHIRPEIACLFVRIYALLAVALALDAADHHAVIDQHGKMLVDIVPA